MSAETNILRHELAEARRKLDAERVNTDNAYMQLAKAQAALAAAKAEHPSYIAQMIEEERDQLRAEVEKLNAELAAAKEDARSYKAARDFELANLTETRRQLAAAKEDTARLELLAVNAAEVRVEWDDGEGPIPPEFSIVVKGTGTIGRGSTLRAAIDQARKAQP